MRVQIPSLTRDATAGKKSGPAQGAYRFSRAGAFTALALVAGLSAQAALAGRDAGQLIEQQREYKAVAARRASEAASGVREQRVVLPLDHGPHAATTPDLNRARLEKLRAESAASSARQTR